MKFSAVLLAASAILFTTASAGLVEVKNTKVGVKKVAHNVANDLRADNAAKNLNADVLSHVLSHGGDHHD